MILDATEEKFKLFNNSDYVTKLGIENNYKVDIDKINRIYFLRMRGLTYKEIGKMFNLTQERIRQVIVRVDDVLKKENLLL